MIFCKFKNPRCIHVVSFARQLPPASGVYLVGMVQGLFTKKDGAFFTRSLRIMRRNLLGEVIVMSLSLFRKSSGGAPEFIITSARLDAGDGDDNSSVAWLVRRLRSRSLPSFHTISPKRPRTAPLPPPSPPSFIRPKLLTRAPSKRRAD